MLLSRKVNNAFSENGEISKVVAPYFPRVGQVQMALAISEAIENNDVLVVEAGTGIGKTFAYLTPALLSGNRILISTATKNLQDQLFHQDLPLLMKALKINAQIALLKGRSSYLCWYRLKLARHQESKFEIEDGNILLKVEAWAELTRTGDIGELIDLEEDSKLLPIITSTRENCLGSSCPEFYRCHVSKARIAVMKAELVIVNHHLFFADCIVKDSGVGELLPNVGTVIFDEAHQLNETGVQFLGEQLSTGQLLEFSRDLNLVGIKCAQGFGDWLDLDFNIKKSVSELSLVVKHIQVGSRLIWINASPNGVDPEKWFEALQGIYLSFCQAMISLDIVINVSPELKRLYERAAYIKNLLTSFSKIVNSEKVRWLEIGSILKMIESPIDISKKLKNEIVSATNKSWVFTSATLGEDFEFKWFKESCGLETKNSLKIESPFDYGSQAVVYVPADFPLPSESEHSQEVGKLVSRLAPIIGGRTLVLTTTLLAMRSISDYLKSNICVLNSVNILVQGEIPKRELIKRFLQGNIDGQSGCILVASASLWEGVDFPGDMLQLVLIDKLPFPPPNDPFVQARSATLTLKKRSAFNEYYMPEACIALKQGAGRLIRREGDHGALVICDTRLITKGYGKRMLKYLPMKKLINSESLLIEYLKKLSLLKY